MPSCFLMPQLTGEHMGTTINLLATVVAGVIVAFANCPKYASLN